MPASFRRVGQWTGEEGKKQQEESNESSKIDTTGPLSAVDAGQLGEVGARIQAIQRKAYFFFTLVCTPKGCLFLMQAEASGSLPRPDSG